MTNVIDYAITSEYSTYQLAEGYCGWEEKFNKESKLVTGNVFHDGTLLQTRVSIHKFNGQLAFRTALSHNVDGRYHDTFYPQGLSDDGIQAFLDNGILELEVQMEILDRMHKDYIISCCLDYTVKIWTVLDCDTLTKPEAINTIPNDKHFVIVGEVCEYQTGDHALLKLKIDNNFIDIGFTSYGVGYNGGSIPKFDPVTPLVGDLVQARILYSSKKNAYMLVSLFLLQECEKRTKVRANIEKDVLSLLNVFETSFQTGQLAILLEYYVDSSNRTLLSDDQINRIKQCILANYGEAKLPFLMRLKECDLYEMKSIALIYNTPKVYAYNLEEFINLCNSIAKCEIRFHAFGGCDYHFRYLNELTKEGLVTTDEFARILMLTITSYQAYIVGKNYRSTDDIAEHTQNDYCFAHKYLLEQAMIYGGDLRSIAMIEMMLGITNNAINQIQEQVDAFDGILCNVDLRDQPTDQIANYFTNQFFTFMMDKEYLATAMAFLLYETKIIELCAKIMEFKHAHGDSETRFDHNIACMGYGLVTLLEAINRIKNKLAQ
jgi:hypothetical protein